MKKTITILALGAMLLMGACSKGPVAPDYYVAAVIWPSCHDDSLARDKFWAEGIGEWEMIKKGTPRFEGHYQPKRPLWGYEMDNDPKVVEKWIDAATSHGVNTFVFDWYWYDDKPYLESCLNDGFLGAPNNGKMNFYIMWANHNVPATMWNCYKYGTGNDSLVFRGAVTPKIYEKLVDRWITGYFSKPNYLKIEGRPVFWIYSMYCFLETFGGDVDAAAEAVKYLDRKCVEAGFKGVYLQANNNGYNMKDSEEKAAADRELFAKLQIRNQAFYTMTSGNFRVPDYLTYGSAAVRSRKIQEKSGIPVVPTVSVGWDNTPRYLEYGEPRVVHLNRTPENFKYFLEIAKCYLDSHPEQPRLVLINAWNEWIEDAYLMPDEVYGFKYLEAVDEVFGKK